MQLDQLEPGQRFLCPYTGETGQLVSLTPSCATVSLDRAPQLVEFESHGETVQFVRSGGRRTTWARSVPVIEIE